MGIEAGSSTYYQAKRGIVQDGLIVCLDGAVQQSNPGSSNSWKNLASSSYNATLYNTPTITKEYGGGIDCDGTNENAKYTIILPYALTVITWARSNLSLWDNYAGFGSARYQNGFILHNNIASKTISFFIMNGDFAAGHTHIGSYNGFSNIEIPMMIASSTNGSNIHKIYINGSYYTTNTTSITRSESPTVSSTVNLCSDNPSGRYNNMKMYSHYLYNRQLSDNEVAQIYNATRHRFGL